MSLVYVCDNCNKELDRETLKFEISHEPLKHPHGIPEITGDRSSKGGHFCSEKCVAEHLDKKTKTKGSGTRNLYFSCKCDRDIDRIAKEISKKTNEKMKKKGLI